MVELRPGQLVSMCVELLTPAGPPGQVGDVADWSTRRRRPRRPCRVFCFAACGQHSGSPCLQFCLHRGEATAALLVSRLPMPESSQPFIIISLNFSLSAWGCVSAPVSCPCCVHCPLVGHLVTVSVTTLTGVVSKCCVQVTLFLVTASNPKSSDAGSSGVPEKPEVRPERVACRSRQEGQCSVLRA